MNSHQRRKAERRIGKSGIWFQITNSRMNMRIISGGINNQEFNDFIIQIKTPIAINSKIRTEEIKFRPSPYSHHK